MKKLSVSFIIASLVLTLNASGCARDARPHAGDPSDDEVHIGEVRLVSAGKEYAPYENWIYALDKSGLCADGERKRPEDIASELEAIPVFDDAYIHIEGQEPGKQIYTLYNERYEELYSKNEFTVPGRPKTYYLRVQVTWGTEKAYEGFQYFFKLEKQE